MVAPMTRRVPQRPFGIVIDNQKIFVPPQSARKCTQRRFVMAHRPAGHRDGTPGSDLSGHSNTGTQLCLDFAWIMCNLARLALIVFEYDMKKLSFYGLIFTIQAIQANQANSS